jgi:hypothetical protein
MSTPNIQDHLTVENLLDAELTLSILVNAMALEYSKYGKDWKRDWMQKHVNDRATLIRARSILIDRAEAANNT